MFAIVIASPSYGVSVRDCTLMRRANAASSCNALRETLDEAAQIGEFVLKFETQRPHIGAGKRIGAFGHDPKRANHLAGTCANLSFRRLLGGHD
jgi:hypothetical protein